MVLKLERRPFVILNVNVTNKAAALARKKGDGGEKNEIIFEEAAPPPISNQG